MNRVQSAEASVCKAVENTEINNRQRLDEKIRWCKNSWFSENNFFVSTNKSAYLSKSGKTSGVAIMLRNLDRRLLSVNLKPAHDTLVIISQNGLQTTSNDILESEEPI